MWITFFIKLPNYAIFFNQAHFHMLKIVLISYPQQYNFFPLNILKLFTIKIYENTMKDNVFGLPKPLFIKIIKNIAYVFE